MKRIIITEVDNTSNVEQLSSYDVVYVPGFSTMPADPNYFRNPTLVTSKYQFKKMFGETVPTFDVEQHYPVATTTTDGFPSYAIPNYSSLVVDGTSINLTSFTDIVDDPFTMYYTKVDIVAGQDQDDWIPTDQTNYFLAIETAANQYTVEYTRLPLDEGATYVQTYGENGTYWTDNEVTGIVCQSAMSPLEAHWYENIGTELDPAYRVTGDTQINYTESDGGQTMIKKYYQSTRNTPPMFDAGDADPGYRYALYLLTIGIPVYYECMNCGNNWVELDLKSDFQSSLIKYGTIDEGNTDDNETAVRYISPYNQGWWYYNGTSYVKCDDSSIKYTQASDIPDTATWYSGADISLDSMYTGLKKRFMTDPSAPDYSFDSIGDYSIKYVTSGGYPTFEYGRLSESNEEDAPSGLAYAMMELCFNRGDAVALIDHTDNPERSIYEEEELSVIYKVRDTFANIDEKVATHGAMFTPWYSCTHAVITGEGSSQWSVFMPASLAYLSSLSTQLKNYNPWLAVSGVSRGKVPYFGSLHTNYALTNNVADSYQSVPSDEISDQALISINPITYIRQYGYCIWGNRTLRNNKLGTKASSFLNIRNIVSDIKKKLYETSQQLLFEQNTDVLWLNFKSQVTPLLDNMVSNYILSDYKLTKYNIDPDSGDPVPAYMVLASLKIMPINSVEVFDLTIQLENNEISVAEEE